MYKCCNLSPGFDSRLRSQSLGEGSIYAKCRDLRNYKVYTSLEYKSESSLSDQPSCEERRVMIMLFQAIPALCS